MTRIQADLARLADAEAAFGMALQTFEDTLSELENNLQVHLAAWTGDARRAYTEFHDIWHVSARDLAGQLDRLRRALGVTHHNFTSARSASLRMWTPA